MSSVVSFSEIFDWHEWIVISVFFTTSIALIIFGIVLGVRHEHKRSRSYKNKWAAVTAFPCEESVLVSLSETSQTILHEATRPLSPLKRRAAKALKLSREPDSTGASQLDAVSDLQTATKASSTKTVGTNELTS